MKTPLQLLKGLIRPVCYPLLRSGINLLDSYLTLFQRERFYQQLKSHGKDCLVQWPIQVSGHDRIVLGDKVTRASYVHMWGEGGISGGNRVMIASHTAITTLTHDYGSSPMNETLIEGSVVIEDDVWIGAHSVIVPGVTIGKGAVIGAGSIVTKNVEAFTIVAGIPARKLKSRNVKGETDD